MSEPSGNKGPTPEEEAATKVATKCIRDCQLEQLIVDSKFLREESLLELIKVGCTRYTKHVLAYMYSLSLYHLIQTFNDAKKEAFLKQEKEKMLVTSIFSLSNNVFYPSQKEHHSVVKLHLFRHLQML